MITKVYKIKLRHILPTFIKIILFVVGGLAILRLLFSIYFDIIEINRDKWEFWLPFFLPFLPVIIWLNPKFKILKYKNVRSKGILAVIAISAIILMGINMQKYISEYTKEIIHLDTVEQIETYNNVSHYKFKAYNVDFEKINKYSYMEDKGKYTLISMYIVVPFKITKSSFKYWYCINFKEEISKSLTIDKKKEAYTQFVNFHNERMINYDFSLANHFERLPKCLDKEKYLVAIHHEIEDINDSNNIILSPVFEPYENKYQSRLIWLGYSFIGSILIFILFLIFPKYSKAAHNKNYSYMMYIKTFKEIFYIK